MAQVLLVASGAGGAGKTTVTVFLGRSLAELGKRVLLVEMAAGLRSLDMALGLEGTTVYDLADLLLGRCPPDKAVSPVPRAPGLGLVSAPGDPAFVPGQREYEAFARWARTQYDFVLIDAPSHLAPGFVVPAAVSNGALLVAVPQPASVRGGATFSGLLRQMGVTRQRLLINRVPGQLTVRQGLGDLDDVIDGVGAQLLGVVPAQREVADAMVLGKPLATEALAARAFANIAQRLCGHQAELAVQ